jgi:hypothetical protein
MYLLKVSKIAPKISTGEIILAETVIIGTIEVSIDQREITDIKSIPQLSRRSVKNKYTLAHTFHT